MEAPCLPFTSDCQQFYPHGASQAAICGRNVCTHGYTMAWWDWQRWELELVSSGTTLPRKLA